jgi:flagellar hook-basal body complex protein FliE
MAISFVTANAAYQNAARIGEASSSAQGAGGAVPSQSFGSILEGSIKDAMSNMRAGEVAAAQGAAGQGDVVNVVNAVTAAELTLETVVAILDKVISAYQDIMRMPI